MITTYWIILILVGVVSLITILSAVGMGYNAPNWLDISGVIGFIVLLITILLAVISALALKKQNFLASEYNLGKMSDFYEVKYHYEDNIEEPYIECRRLFGMEEYHYYIPINSKYEEFRLTETTEQIQETESTEVSEVTESIESIDGTV